MNLQLPFSYCLKFFCLGFVALKATEAAAAAAEVIKKAVWLWFYIFLMTS